MAIKPKQNPNRLISIIIPSFKAEKFIEKSLLDIKSAMDQTRYRYEIICVVDGQVDNTYNEAQKAAKKHPKIIKVIGYLINMGKGHAVRYGMAQAGGEIIGFIDAGSEINPNAISILLEHFEWYNADIIIGSKRHPASKIEYPWQRKFVSIGYQVLVKILFGLNVKDTQAGIKFFKREVLIATLGRLVVKAFAFDIEILAVANYLGYKRIYEAPIELKMDFGSGISTIASRGFIKTSFATLWDTLAVFYRLEILKYYDNKNKINWITPEYLKISEK